jgi:hypothetical protein
MDTNLTGFDERQQQEVHFCIDYVGNFNHGTDGHGRMTVVAKLYQRVIELSNEIVKLKYQLTELMKCGTSMSVSVVAKSLRT